jgi:hypothetical protein
VLRKLISGYYTHSAQEKDTLLAFVEEVPKTYFQNANKIAILVLHLVKNSEHTFN